MKTCKIDIPENDLLAAMRRLVRDILALEDITAVLAPVRRSTTTAVMPLLISDPQWLDAMDPLTPSFPFSAARMASRLTRKASTERMAVLLRPCEIRGFVELVKLHQGHREDLLIIGYDCLGAYTNRDYRAFIAARPSEPGESFYRHILTGQDTPLVEGIDLAPACRMCDAFLPEGADIAVGLVGMDGGDHLLVQGLTAMGEAMLDNLGLPSATVPDKRTAEIKARTEQRRRYREAALDAVAEATDTPAKLAAFLQGCVNCYNCRVACPVCYCRECVFVTDTFDHDPMQYLEWAQRRGAVRMPTDTLFYHLTRMAHSSTACVSCGQCSNACPNDIDVAALMGVAARRTQAAFDYQAGRDLEAKPPLTEFREVEFEEIVGIDDTATPTLHKKDG